MRTYLQRSKHCQEVWISNSFDFIFSVNKTQLTSARKRIPLLRGYFI